MTTFDPFAEPEDATEESTEAEAPEVPQQRSSSSVGDSEAFKVRATLKAGGGYEAPWVTLDFPSIQEAERELHENAEALSNTLKRVARINEVFASTEQKAQGQAQQKPVKDQAPGGRQEHCQHGEMTFRNGFNQQKQKYWSAFFCPAQNKQDQCKPVFL